MRPEDLLIRMPADVAPAFEVLHEPCGSRLLYTQHVHVDTLLALRCDACPEPEPLQMASVGVAGRPTLLSYSGVRVDLDDHLWVLYLRAGEDSAARTMLYEKAGAGGWDDACRDCYKQRFEHGGSDHFFISEEQ